MNQSVTVGAYNKVAYFYASDASTNLGLFSKDVGAAVLFRLDYSELTVPPGTETESFTVDVGSNPPLAVSTSYYDEAAKSLDFIVLGGLEGQQYVLSITIAGTLARTDTITIDVPLTTCGCGVQTSLNQAEQFPVGEGMVFINSALKYTVSSTQPLSANYKDEWYNPSTNTLYEYLTDGASTWWQQIATTPSTFSTNKLNSITPDGTTTQFTLLTTQGKSPNVIVSSDLLVSLNGVVQNPDLDYKAFKDIIQFTVAPLVNDIIFMVWYASS